MGDFTLWYPGKILKFYCSKPLQIFVCFDVQEVFSLYDYSCFNFCMAFEILTKGEDINFKEYIQEKSGKSILKSCRNTVSDVILIEVFMVEIIQIWFLKRQKRLEGQE